VGEGAKKKRQKLHSMHVRLDLNSLKYAYVVRVLVVR
jgi:hypothetical protein